MTQKYHFYQKNYFFVSNSNICHKSRLMEKVSIPSSLLWLSEEETSLILCFAFAIIVFTLATSFSSHIPFLNPFSQSDKSLANRFKTIQTFAGVFAAASCLALFDSLNVMEPPCVSVSIFPSLSIVIFIP